MAKMTKMVKNKNGKMTKMVKNGKMTKMVKN